MNTQERAQLEGFLDQLVSARPGNKDGEAETLIREAAQRQPDALYLLVQRALIQAQALQSAQDEIARLRSQSSSGSFMGGNNWGNRPAAPIAPAAPAAGASSFGNGWLGNVATTAAGVVAGSFLFQGIENLLGHHGNSQGLLDKDAQAAAPQETVANQQFAENDMGSFDSLDDGIDNGGDSWL